MPKKVSRIDLLFEIVMIYTRNMPKDLTRPTQLLCHHVALDKDLFYRRDVFSVPRVIRRPICILGNEDVLPALTVTPIILV